MAIREEDVTKWREDLQAANTALEQIQAQLTTVRSQIGKLTSVFANTLQPTPNEPAAGGGWTLIKDWTFGTDGNVRNVADLNREFDYHDQFGSISNGDGNYGTVTVATSAATRTVSALPGLGGWQPVDDNPASPFRVFEKDRLVAHVRSLYKPAPIGPMAAPDDKPIDYQYNAGCGSLVAKFALPAGARDLNKTICWETKARMINAPAGYWFAIWCAGGKWTREHGPEMDVLEAYSGTAESGLVNGDAFHVNSVGGVDERFNPNQSWWRGLEQSGMPGMGVNGSQNLMKLHTFTWIYKPDDTYEVWIDRYRFQVGKLVWRHQPSPGVSESVPMHFLFDFAALHKTGPINKTVIPASSQPLSYEIYHSRLWTR